MRSRSSVIAARSRSRCCSRRDRTTSPSAHAVTSRAIASTTSLIRRSGTPATLRPRKLAVPAPSPIRASRRVPRLASEYRLSNINTESYPV